MKVKVTIPEDISDITLGQYQEYEALNDKLNDKEIDVKEYNKQKISLFAGIPYNRMNQVSYKDFAELLKDIDKALDQECKFVNRFTIDNIEFGFIPNFDKIASKEFFDLQNYSKEKETGKGIPIDTLNKLIAVLFRPITKEDKFNNYKIKNYNGTEKYGELMKKTPMNAVKGALVFFCSLSRELRNHITKFTAEAHLKEQERQTSLLNGGGMIPS